MLLNQFRISIRGQSGFRQYHHQVWEQSQTSTVGFQLEDWGANLSTLV